MFEPSKKSLEKYADVLINFALNSGKGIKRNQVVYIVSQTPGLALAKEVYRSVLKSGGYPLVQIVDDDFKLMHLMESDDRQLEFFPSKYYKGLADSIDHWVRILSDKDPLFLKQVEPQRIMRANKSARKFRDWLDEKEDKGAFTWTLCLYGTEGLAQQAGMSLKEYWGQIQRACFLDKKDPVSEWKRVFSEVSRIQKKLTSLQIERVHVEAPGTDLWVDIGPQRRWLGGSGRNIPSFEIFTSPDWHGTEGTVAFDLPLYRYGNIIKDIRLTFKKGKVVEAKASKNQRFLEAMVAQKNADKVGEFSLTDRRFSRITRFMADSLYDENFGGTYGNMHLALGKAYHDAYDGDASKMSEKQFRDLGFNSSVEHTDIIAGTNRKVTAILPGGKSRVIYEKGQFKI